MKRVAASVVLAGLTMAAHAQHLWWKHPGQEDTTCIYGEVTVLATSPAIYYCGANWHPGEPAGGYCGIQHNSLTEKRTIFSVWDTSPSLHSQIGNLAPDAITSRYGNEGTGVHTHMIWNWNLGQTFRFFVRKHPSKGPNYTSTDYFIYDPSQQSWRLSASIDSPEDKGKSVQTIAGGLCSFLENFAGKNKDIAKIATYNLWLGHTPKDMKRLREVVGDGTFGKLGDSYFLAEGSAENLANAFSQLAPRYGQPLFGSHDKPLPPLMDMSLSQQLVQELLPLGAATT